MSDVAQDTGASVSPYFNPMVVELDPAEVVVLDDYDYRPHSQKMRPSKEQQADIEAMARDLVENGQRQEGWVLAHYDDSLEANLQTPVYIILSGHRRRAAALLANENGQSIKLKFKVCTDKSRAWEIGLTENLFREDPSPLDLAEMLPRLEDLVRSQYVGLDKLSKTKMKELIGEKIGKSRFSVNQLYTLREASPDIKDQVRAGKMDAQAAVAATQMSEEPQVQAKVIEKAAEIEKEKLAGRVERAKKQKEAGTIDQAAADRRVDRAEKRAASGKITKDSVVKAGKQVPEVAERTNTPASKKDIIEWFDQQDGSGNGYANGAVRTFVQYFTNKWCKNATNFTTKKLQGLWDDMVAKAPKGTKSAEDEME